LLLSPVSEKLAGSI